MAPSIPYYNYIGGYDGICESLGYKLRFSGQPPTTTQKLNCPIVVDTREQKPLKIPHDTVSHSLKCGDYGLDEPFNKDIFIDRKSFMDFVGTLSSRETRTDDSNYARFIREIERAAEVGAYIVMLVEHPLSECAAFDSIPFLKVQTSRLRVTPDHIFYNLRALTHRFVNFQPLFVKNRAEAANIVVKLLEMGDAVKTFDLQLAYEEGKLEI
jgi:ERCC4-type nuclease